MGYSNSLAWRQEVVGQIMPALIGLLLAVAALGVAWLQGLTAEVKRGNADRAKLSDKIDTNHAETLAAVSNGPANAAFREIKGKDDDRQATSVGASPIVGNDEGGSGVSTYTQQPRSN